MKTSVFFLEDNPHRYVYFNKWIENKLDEFELVTATEADEAIEIMRARKHFDVVFLDHDLGGKVFVNSNDENTGYQVAKFMKRNGNTFNQLIIHSQNPAGADNINHIFPEAMKIPFPELMHQ